jgi:hypothetical protein
MPDYTQFFLNSPSNIVQLETIEVSHPSFSKIYRYVRNAINGIANVTLEDASVVSFDYGAMKLRPAKASDDLDYALKVDFADLGQIVPQELDNVNAAGTFMTKPVFKYRTFRSDDFSAPLFGPLVLAVNNLAFTKEGVGFDAQAPKINISSTGELYTTNRFPMLKGFL